VFFPQQFRRPTFHVRFILFPPLCDPRPFGMNHKWTMQQSCISVANQACEASREAVTAGLHCSCISSLPGRRLRVVVHAAAVHPAVPPVNSRPSLVSGRSLHFLEHSARRSAVTAVCTVCLFLLATARHSWFTSHFLTFYFKFLYYVLVDFATAIGCFSHAKSSRLTLTLTAHREG